MAARRASFAGGAGGRSGRDPLLGPPKRASAGCGCETRADYRQRHRGGSCVSSCVVLLRLFACWCLHRAVMKLLVAHCETYGQVRWFIICNISADECLIWTNHGGLCFARCATAPVTGPGSVVNLGLGFQPIGQSCSALLTAFGGKYVGKFIADVSKSVFRSNTFAVFWGLYIWTKFAQCSHLLQCIFLHNFSYFPWCN
jgi:hypothetical protein